MAFESCNAAPPAYRFRNFHVPPAQMVELVRFVEQGIKPNRFLCAVLENDLNEACKQGDDLNLCNLPAFAAYLNNEASIYCWGTPERVAAWVARGGLECNTPNIPHLHNRRT